MCLDDQILSCYVDGELEEPWKSQVEEHLVWCNSCSKRLEELKSLHKIVNDAVLSDNVIDNSKERVSIFLEKNVLHKKSISIKQKISNFFRNRIVVPALSVCVTFCVCLFIFNQKEPSKIMSPIVPSAVNMENIVPVRASDNYSTSQSLKNYSLEEIIKYLDSCGYDVSIKLKVIEPITTLSSIEYNNELD